MLPYLIAGTIGYVVAKLFEEDEAPKYANGGDVNNKTLMKNDFLNEQTKLQRNSKYAILLDATWNNYTDEMRDVLDNLKDELIKKLGYNPLNNYRVFSNKDSQILMFDDDSNLLGLLEFTIDNQYTYVPRFSHPDIKPEKVFENNENVFYIKYIFSFGKGKGQKMMNQIKKYANKYNVAIGLEGSVVEKSRGKYMASAKHLERFYDKQGFVNTEYNYFLYNPNSKLNNGGSVLLAPNGKRSNLTPEQYKLVRTPEFKAWFGDWQNDPAKASKVVDENGEPLVVWRGVKSNRNYEYQKTGYNYFAKNKSYGKVYGDILHPFFLNIRNPLDLEFFNKISSENGLTSFNNEGLFQIGDLQLTNQFENETTLLYLDDLNDVADKFYYLFENGDGIIGYDIGYYGKEIVFVTKHPNQIKLADGTNTTFDGNNPDIRFEVGGKVFNDNELLEKWKKGESIGFTAIAHLKSKGLIPRADGKKRKSEKYMKDGGSVLLAPNRKPSNLTPEQYKLVRTPAFKEWFGDWENDPENASEVVDEETKEPLVVYHGYLVGGGAGRKFYEFKKLPAFFSKTKKFAYEYASTKSMDGGIDADIDTYACFLNIRKLFDSKNKENIKLAEEQLPEKIRVSHGTAWFLSADIPKEEVIEQMMGIITIQTDDLLVKDILSSNVGDIIAEKVSASQYENKILLYKDEDWGYITDAQRFDEIVNEEIAEWVNNDYEKTIKYKGKYLKTFILIEGTYKLELNKDPLFLEFQNEVKKRKKYYIDNFLKLLKQSHNLTITIKDKTGYPMNFYVQKINLKTYKTTTKNNWTMFENETLQKFLIDNNFGGWCALERGDKTYGVYNANNIKLADGSNTKFDSNNPDIRFDEGGKLADNIFDYFKEKGFAPLGNQFWGKSNCTIKIDFSNVLYLDKDNRVWSSPIEYNDYKKAFTILEFHCKDKKKGIGTAVLKEIIQGADLFGYTIFIEPTSMKKYRIETDINTNDLKEWYSKYDFKPLNDNYSDYVWLRNPKNPDIQYAGGGKVKSEYIKRVKEAIEYVENSAKARMIIDFEDEEGSKQAFNEGKDYERIFPIKSKPNSFVVKRIRDGVQEKYDAYGIWNEKTKSYDYQYPKNTKYGDKSKEFDTLQIATYDDKGKIVGTIKIATTENKQEDVKKGAFKIAVRQDYQNKGIASKLIEKAESEGIDFLEALKNNKFTSKGRGYFISWLNKKLN